MILARFIPKFMVENEKFTALAKAIGAKIKELRLERGYSTAGKLALALNVSPDAVKAYEKGENLTQFIKLIELARILRTTPNIILGVADDPPHQAGRLVEDIEAQLRSDDELFEAVITGALLGLRFPLEEAAPYAAAALEALHSPAVRNTGKDRLDIARIVAQHAVGRIAPQEK